MIDTVHRVLPDGFEGVCKIEKTHVQETRFGTSFFCEMTTASGQRVVWRQNITSPAADSSLLQWAAAASGVSPEDYKLPGPGALRIQEMLRQAAASPEANDFTQRYVLVRVTRLPTKNGRVFSLHRFYPYPGSPPAKQILTEERTRPARKLRLVK